MYPGPDGRTRPATSNTDVKPQRKDPLMNPRVLLAAALLLLPATQLLAQIPAVPSVPTVPSAPGAPGTTAQQAAAGPSQTVNVANKCCSIWDCLGVAQAGKFIRERICATQFFTAFNAFLGPLGKVLGIGPSLANPAFANEGGAMGLASKLKAEEAKAKLKVQAIKYLGTLDCNCYPEIVDVLLASLDDCAEIVRYAALQALHKKCADVDACGKHRFTFGPTGEECACCRGCQCQKKVVERLNDLLLERDPNGCLKEKSERIRCLATQMIEECLSRHQLPPQSAPEQAPRPDIVPVPVPDRAPAPRPDARPSARMSQPTTGDKPSPFFSSWMKTKPASMTTSKPVAPAAQQPMMVQMPVEQPVLPVAPMAAPAAPVAVARPKVASAPVRQPSKPVVVEAAKPMVVDAPKPMAPVAQKPVIVEAPKTNLSSSKKPVVVEKKATPIAASKPVEHTVAKKSGFHLPTFKKEEKVAAEPVVMVEKTKVATPAPKQSMPVKTTVAKTSSKPVETKKTRVADKSDKMEMVEMAEVIMEDESRRPIGLRKAQVISGEPVIIRETPKTVPAKTSAPAKKPTAQTAPQGLKKTSTVKS